MGFENSDEQIIELINLIKSCGIKVNLVQLDCSVEEAKNRSERVKEDPMYYSSYYLNEEIITVLPNFINDMAINDNIEETK